MILSSTYSVIILPETSFRIKKKRKHGSYLKIEILIQDQGGAEF